MEMQVNTELCTGCGACVEICPNEAIQLRKGLPFFDQAACTQCQSCVDVCPVGAITAVELPITVMKPAVVQPVRETETVHPKLVSSRQNPWLSTVLAFASLEILPRLTDTLLNALDQRLAQIQNSQSQASLPSQNTEFVSRQKDGQGYRRRRYGLKHQQGRGRGRGVGRRNWK